jgi:hypothetical protein
MFGVISGLVTAAIVGFFGLAYSAVLWANDMQDGQTQMIHAVEELEKRVTRYELRLREVEKRK